MAVLTWPQTFVPPGSLNQRGEGSTSASRNVLSITHQLSCPRTEEEYAWSKIQILYNGDYLGWLPEVKAQWDS